MKELNRNILYSMFIQSLQVKILFAIQIKIIFERIYYHLLQTEISLEKTVYYKLFFLLNFINKLAKPKILTYNKNFDCNFLNYPI